MRTKLRSTTGRAAVVFLFVALIATLLMLGYRQGATRLSQTHPVSARQLLGPWSILRDSASSETITFHPDGTADAKDDFAYRWSVEDGVVRLISWEKQPSSPVGYVLKVETEDLFVPHIHEGRMELRGASVILVRAGTEGQ